MKVRQERWPLFDLMRVAAAVGVVISHAHPLTGTRTVALFSTPSRDYNLGQLCVGVFFVLSGWLITASWGRRSAGQFAARRFLRIMPGLVAAVAFTVFVIGPLMTTRSGYFTAPETWGHLANNALMRPLGERELPGVFDGNPFPGIVNGSLWTLPHEAISYLAVAVLGAVGMLRRSVALVLCVAVLVLVQAGLPHTFAGPTGLLLDDLAVLGAWFLIGSALYLCRELVPWTRAGALAAVTLLLVANGTALVLPAVAYLILYMGTRPSNLHLPAKMGDPSYGIYVYAFPVQQALVAAGIATTAATQIIVGLPIIVALGVASWWLIERPAMRSVQQVDVDARTGDEVGAVHRGQGHPVDGRGALPAG